MRIAIFIDVANLEISAKYKQWRIDYRKLYEWLKSLGDIQYCGFFTARFSTKSHDGFLTVIKKLGYKLVTKPLKIIKSDVLLRKANFDVEITVEAISKSKNYEKIILFSGDSDFDYLLNFLKKNYKKKIIVISSKLHISRELIAVSDLFIDLKKIINIVGRN